MTRPHVTAPGAKVPGAPDHHGPGDAGGEEPHAAAFRRLPQAGIQRGHHETAQSFNGLQEITFGGVL